MQYKNKHLIEVSCGFNFLNETVAWDSIYFGQFFERIQQFGFNKREERKGFQINFEGKADGSKPPVTSSSVEDQVIFRNPDKGWAVIMGQNKVSFHIVKGYPGWDTFTASLFEPLLKEYKNLGLGNGPRNCRVVYLNAFTKSTEERLSDYFTIISPLEQKFGIENNTFVQRTITNRKNVLIAKLNSTVIGANMNITLECGALCNNNDCMNSPDMLFQANQTHDPIKDFFEAIITEKLRKDL